METRVKKFKNDSFASVRDINKQLGKAQSTLATDESKAILQINTAYNACKQELDVKLQQGQEIIKTIKTLKMIAQDTKTSIKNAEIEAKKRAEKQYNLFEEKLQDKMDEEREELREWLENQTSTHVPDQRTMTELQEEKDKLTAERKLL